MAVGDIQPGNPPETEPAAPDRDDQPEASVDALLLLKSWIELFDHPENLPGVCLDLADQEKNDASMRRLKPILGRLALYADEKESAANEIYREKALLSTNKAGQETLIVGNKGSIESIGKEAVEILGFAAGENVKDAFLEPLSHLFRELEDADNATLSEIFGRDGVRRLVNVKKSACNSGEQDKLQVSLCNVFLPAAAANYLRQKLALTEAEIEILSLSIRRYNIERIANKRSSSVSTIRTHIKNITSKFGCRNFNDVIARTLEIIAYHQKDRPSVLDEIGDFFPMRQKAQILKLRRHRGQIEYSIYGDSNMRPLLTLHSLEYGYKPSDEFISLARKSGFCIYSVRRPGFGLSSPSATIGEDAERLEEFLRLLNLENIVVVSFSTASPLTIALAHSSERISKTILVNYAFNAKSKIKNVKPTWLKGLLDLCMASQASFNFAYMLTGNLIRVRGYSEFYEKIYESCTEDLAYLREHVGEFEKAAKLLLSADKDTIRREIVGGFMFNPEVNELLGARQDIISVMGEHTHGVPLDRARAEAEKWNAAFFVIENAGRNCVFQRPEAFFKIVNSLQPAETAHIN